MSKKGNDLMRVYLIKKTRTEEGTRIVSKSKLGTTVIYKKRGDY